MPNGVDGVAAARRLLSFRNIDPGMCLSYVWQAYKYVGARASGTFATALDGWFGSPGKHHGDWNPPAGVPVWFGAKAGSSAGDVVISLGNGMVAATDYPRYGVVGTCSIAQRAAQINRPYLGWTETILGAPVAFGDEPSQASDNAKPFVPPKEDDYMYLIDAPDRGTALIAGRHFRSLTEDEANSWRKVIPFKRVDAVDFDRIRATGVWGDPDYMPSSTLTESTQDLIRKIIREEMNNGH